MSQVDNYLKMEAEALQRAVALLKNYAAQIDAEIKGLGNVALNLVTNQVSGPPGELLHGLWNDFSDNTLKVKDRLYALIDKYERQAVAMLNKYQDQVVTAAREAEATAKSAADKAEAAKKAADKVLNNG